MSWDITALRQQKSGVFLCGTPWVLCGFLEKSSWGHSEPFPSPWRGGLGMKGLKNRGKEPAHPILSFEMHRSQWDKGIATFPLLAMTLG